MIYGPRSVNPGEACERTGWGIARSGYQLTKLLLIVLVLAPGQFRINRRLYGGIFLESLL